MAQAALGLAGLWVSERRTTVGAVLLQVRLEHVLSLLDPHSSLALRVRTRLAGAGLTARARPKARPDWRAADLVSRYLSGGFGRE